MSTMNTGATNTCATNTGTTNTSNISYHNQRANDHYADIVYDSDDDDNYGRTCEPDCGCRECDEKDWDTQQDWDENTCYLDSQVRTKSK